MLAVTGLRRLCRFDVERPPSYQRSANATLSCAPAPGAALNDWLLMFRLQALARSLWLRSISAPTATGHRWRCRRRRPPRRFNAEF